MCAIQMELGLRKVLKQIFLGTIPEPRSNHPAGRSRKEL